MTAPQAVLDAVAQVSGTIPCIDGCDATVEISYSAELDQVIIRHPVAHSFGTGAAALAWYVNEELARFVAMGDYEPAPIHTVVTP